MNDYTLENMVEWGGQSSTYRADDVCYSAVEAHYKGKAADKDTGYAARAPVDPEAIAFNEGYASNSVKFIFEMEYAASTDEFDGGSSHDHCSASHDDFTALVVDYTRSREIGKVQGTNFTFVENMAEC